MTEITVSRQFGVSSSGYDYSRPSSAIQMGSSYYKKKQLESGIRGSGYYDPQTGEPVYQSMSQEEAERKGYEEAEKYHMMSESERRAATRDWRYSEAVERGVSTQPIPGERPKSTISVGNIMREQGVWYPQEKYTTEDMRQLQETQRLRQTGQQRAATLEHPTGKSYQETAWQIENLGRRMEDYDRRVVEFGKSRTMEEQKKMWSTYPHPQKTYEALTKEGKELTRESKILGFQLKAARAGLIEEHKVFSKAGLGYEGSPFQLVKDPKKVKISKIDYSYDTKLKPVSFGTGGSGVGTESTLRYLGEMSAGTEKRIMTTYGKIGEAYGVPELATGAGHLAVGGGLAAVGLTQMVVSSPRIALAAATDPVGTVGGAVETIAEDPQKFALQTAGGAIMLSGGWSVAKSLARGGVTIPRPSLPGSLRSLKGIKGVTVHSVKTIPARLKTAVTRPMSRINPFYAKYRLVTKPLTKPQYVIKRFDFIGKGKTGFGRVTAQPKWFAEMRVPAGIGVKPALVKGIKAVPSKIKTPFKTVKYKFGRLSPFESASVYKLRPITQAKAAWLGDRTSAVAIPRSWKTMRYIGQKIALKSSVKKALARAPQRLTRTMKMYSKKVSPFERYPKYSRYMGKNVVFDPAFAKDGGIIANLGTPRFYVTSKYVGEGFRLKPSLVKALKTPPSKMIKSRLPTIKTAPSTVVKKKWKSFMRQRDLNYLDDVMKKYERKGAFRLGPEKWDDLKNLRGTAEYNLRHFDDYVDPSRIIKRKPFVEPFDGGKQVATAQKLEYSKFGIKATKTKIKFVELGEPMKATLKKTVYTSGPLELTKKTGVYVDVHGPQTYLKYTGKYTGQKLIPDVTRLQKYYKETDKIKPEPTTFKATGGPEGQTVQITKTRPVDMFTSDVPVQIVHTIPPGAPTLVGPATMTMAGVLVEQSLFTPDVTHVTKMDFKPITKNIIKLGEIVESRQDTIMKVDTMSLADTMSRTDSMSLADTMSRTDSMSLADTMSRTDTMSRVDTKTQQKLATLSLTKAAVAQKQAQAQAVKTHLLVAQKQVLKPRLLLLPQLALKEKKSLFKPAFVTEVKKKGKWFAIGIPAPKNIATLKGIEETKGTAARTFRLVKAGKTKRRDIKQPSLWMFRRKKPKSKLPSDVYIEKTKYAIDTPGELKEITLKGIQAPRKKKRKPWFSKIKI